MAFTIRLLAIASRAEYPVLVMAVVSTYRCGAAPDSHRVPFSSRREPGTDNHKI
jgi:hypothetical protein